MAEFALASLGEVASEVRDRLGSSETDRPIYGVEKNTGLKPGPRYQSSDLSKYKAVRRGAFAYNPMRLNIGSIGFCSEDMQEGFVSPDYVVFEFNQEQVNPEFFNYHIKQRIWLDWLALSGEGSVRERIYFRKLEKYKFLLPPIGQQRAIVGVLKSLDGKIELNRRMNETLEAQAQALFRDWFVDFGPVKAKVASETPYLAPDLWSLFPNRLDDDGIPEGWRTFRVEELVDHHTKSLKPMDYASEMFEHFSLPAYDSGQQPVLEVGGDIKSNKTIVPNGAILLSKLNPEIPRVWWPQSKGAHRQIASTELLAFTAKSGISPSLLYSLFSDQTFRQRLEGMVTGTSKSHQRVSPPALRSLEALAGDAQVFTAFGQIVTSLMQKVLANRAENHTLAQTRDLLLPKLMSGEIRVRESG